MTSLRVNDDTLAALSLEEWQLSFLFVTTVSVVSKCATEFHRVPPWQLNQHQFYHLHWWWCQFCHSCHYHGLGVNTVSTWSLGASFSSIEMLTKSCQRSSSQFFIRPFPNIRAESSKRPLVVAMFTEHCSLHQQKWKYKYVSKKMFSASTLSVLASLLQSNTGLSLPSCCLMLKSLIVLIGARKKWLSRRATVGTNKLSHRRKRKNYGRRLFLNELNLI